MARGGGYEGTGFTSAVPDNAKKLVIAGPWTIRGDTFRRPWKFDDHAKKCKSWRKTGGNGVEVIVKGRRIGVNSR